MQLLSAGRMTTQKKKDSICMVILDDAAFSAFAWTKEANIISSKIL